MFDDYMPNARDILRRRAGMDGGKRGYEGKAAKVGRFFCSTCGGCSMHHGGPTCEDACWLLADELGARTCTLCGANRGLIVDYTNPPMPFEQAQHYDLFRPRRWPSFMHYCRFLAELGKVPPTPSGAYVAAQLVLSASEEEKWEALEEAQRIADGEKKGAEFRSKAANN